MAVKKAFHSMYIAAIYLAALFFIRRQAEVTAEEHRKMLGTSFEDVKLENLADISRIRINRELSLDERKKQYVRKTGNPYMVCVGGIKVKVQFTEGGISFDEAFENLLLSV